MSTTFGRGTVSLLELLIMVTIEKIQRMGELLGISAEPTNGTQVGKALFITSDYIEAPPRLSGRHTGGRSTDSIVPYQQLLLKAGPTKTTIKGAQLKQHQLRMSLQLLKRLKGTPQPGSPPKLEPSPRKVATASTQGQSTTKYMRMRDLAMREAERNLQRLNELMAKRLAKDKKIKQNLLDLDLERRHRQGLLEAKRAEARRRASQIQSDLESLSVRSYRSAVQQSRSASKRPKAAPIRNLASLSSDRSKDDDRKVQQSLDKITRKLDQSLKRS